MSVHKKIPRGKFFIEDRVNTMTCNRLSILCLTSYQKFYVIRRTR